MPKLVQGHCAVCDILGKLTKDHVRPKGSAYLSQVRITALAEYMGATPLPGARRLQSRLSQSGVQFPTLCPFCNNTRLGQWYDPELKRISAKVTQVLNAASVLALPEFATIRVKPQRVARAVIGHLLAAVAKGMEGKPTSQTPGVQGMRDYFLDPTAPLPPDLSIFYWTYPRTRVVIARSIVKMNINGRPIVDGDILKFFPLGYWVVRGACPSAPPDALLPTRNLGLDDEIDLPIRFREARPFDFPEAPADDEASMMADTAAVTATLRLTERQQEPPVGPPEPIR